MSLRRRRPGSAVRDLPTARHRPRLATRGFLASRVLLGGFAACRNGDPHFPFANLPKADRARSFPRGQKRAFIFSPDQLAKMYLRLPTHAYVFVRFAVHTGMRLRELTTLTWENVNLEERVAHVEARFAENREARNVALGDVAVSILTPLWPSNASGHVFIGRRGEPIRDIRGAFDAASLEV